MRLVWAVEAQTKAGENRGRINERGVRDRGGRKQAEAGGWGGIAFFL